MKRMIKLAESYIGQAEIRLKFAIEAFKFGNYPYALRLSQECVELSLKAALRIIGIEYPKVHDVSDTLLDFKDKFPEWFRSEINFMAKVSIILAGKREIAFYGGEAEFLTPEELISKSEAEEAIEWARKIFEYCRKLLLYAKKNI